MFRCMEAQKLGGSDMLILAASWIFLMNSGELPRIMFCKKIMIIEYNSEKIYSGGVLGASWGDLEASFGGLGLSWGCLGDSWGGLGVVLGALGAVLGWSWELLGRS